MDFIYINQNVLDNLFYILVSIFVFFVLIDNFKTLKNYQKTLITACMSLPSILCMKFPIYIDEYCVHDLRQIPFLIGILYGGWPVGAALLIISLAIRFFIYGFNSLTLIVYIVIFIITALLSKKFSMFNRKNKLIFSVLLSLCLGILTTSIAVIISDSFRVTEAYMFYFIFLPPVVMFFVVYIIEILSDAISIKSKIAKLEKMEVVSQLAASISHEVRNPLTVVKGFIDLLKAPNLSQEVREQYFQHVVRELKSAETIISEYLAYAKPATEDIGIILIDREIRSIIEMTKPLANMKSVKISEELVPGITRGNIQHFKQCFLNLIKNSIEAMPNGGELSLVTLVSKFDIIIEISDNGVGMTKEQINRFGEPYYSTKEKGTGLGSMVVVKTIETMHGKIKINSVLNKGTTIRITLPIYTS
ncbi:HAMP domain-containing histidine kinase [Bacillus sp. EB106-08-02-XG196]|jgi:two-component system, sporulation sensor kinase B|uniref:sensor histidine kinase n=1 Tax=Bacillus sp. EB106-08-02-XG196 TaxID=2737049 RepID=UPI0015C45DB8|nr:HAMP domain-containing sensor histidine kinase [Bacillus sp. EB106-08-02-XG196]NWQ43341.1 HAMP domain-containing histidine kinase [Bacillus sp. EB106-08-02-XG196]